MKLRVYLAHPISGLSYNDVIAYFESTAKQLTDIGYEVLSPMTGKKELRNELNLRAEGYKNPCSTNHAIVRRDKWCVEHSDVFFLDLIDAQEISIGSTCELAWAYASNVHSIVVLPEESKMRHAFILEMADILYTNHNDAIEYLKKWIEQKEG